MFKWDFGVKFIIFWDLKIWKNRIFTSWGFVARWRSLGFGNLAISHK